MARSNDWMSVGDRKTWTVDEVEMGDALEKDGRENVVWNSVGVKCSLPWDRELS